MATKKTKSESRKAKTVGTKKSAVRDLSPRRDASDAVSGGNKPRNPDGPYVNHNEIVVRG